MSWVSKGQLEQTKKSSKDRPMQSAFLQPNTKQSSRAAIFGDQNDSDSDRDGDFVMKRGGAKGVGNNRASSGSKRQDNLKSSSAEEDAAFAKSILERLYGRLQGSIEIKEDTEMSGSTEATSSNDQSMELDINHQEGEGKDEEEEEEQEDDGLEFRLFASQKEPTKVTLTTKEPEIKVIHIERKDLDEDPASLRMRQIAGAVIDPALVLQQSREPWERQFFAHHIRHLTRKDQTTPKKKKSKKQRDFEKKVKAGLIDQATLKKTARPVKVAESYGLPVRVRKGLGAGTIDSGRPSYAYGAGYYGGFSRGGGGRGRGSDRGRGRGGRGGRGGGGGGGTGAGRGQSRGGFGAVRRGGSFHRP
ncbi:hypothetical protein DFQ26_007826 [Actinomortierella ambigua]|nr:hypothetical protein DFQ26_007826 [Actinomortierella ambigua]